MNKFSSTIWLKQNRLYAGFLLAIIAAFLCGHLAVHAQTPTINYQGKLLDGSGVAVADGSYNIRFWLFQNTGQATTSAIWTEELTGANRVSVQNGLFSVMLGSTSALTAIDFNQSLFLGVEVGGTGVPAWDGEMLPRKPLGTVPAAFTAVEADNAQTLDGVAASSFLRTDQSDIIEATEASTLLTIVQNGAGDIFNLFDGVTEVFTVNDGGNIGIGTTSPYAKLSVAGDLALTGGIYDNTASLGTTGMIMQTTGSGVQWVATSSLGFVDTGATDFLSLTDTPGSYNANRLLFTNSGATALTDSANLTFDGTALTIGSVSISDGLIAHSAASTTTIPVNDPYAWTISTGIGVPPLFRIDTTVGQEFVNIGNGTGNVLIGDIGSASDLIFEESSTISGQGENTVTLGEFGDTFNVAASYFGIGTSSPAQPFTIATTTLLTGALLDSNYTTGTNGMIMQTTGSGVQWVATSSLGLAAAGAGLFTDAGAVTYLTSLTDNLGIGTTSPSSKLDVWGDFRVGTSSTSTLYVDTANNQVLFPFSGSDGLLPGLAFVGDVDTGFRHDYDGAFEYISNGTTKFTFDPNALYGAVGGSPRINLFAGGRFEPTYSFMDDADTGMYSFGEDEINFAVNATEVVTFASSTNVGIGTTSPYAKLSVAGDLALTGGIYDNTASLGTNGMIMQTTGSGVQWVATSSLGIANALSFGVDNQIPFVNSAGDDFDYSSGLTFDNDTLNAVGNINVASSTAGFQIDGATVLAINAVSESLAIGEGAGNVFNDTGLNNIAIGYQAAFGSGSTTESDLLTVIGNQSAYQNTGSNLSSLGFESAYQNTGNNVTAAGWHSAYRNTGNNLTSYGFDSGNENTGSNVTSVGFQSADENTGNNLTAFGYRSAYQNTGENVSAFGFETLRYIATSTNATVFGYRAGRGDLGGSIEASNLTAIGYSAGLNIQTGADNNILIGYQAANSLTTGSNNLIIGYDVEAPSNTADNQLNIGNLIFGTGIDGTGTVLSSGNVGIGTTSPYAKLSVAGDLALTGGIYDNTASLGTNGMIMQTTGSGVQWVATSTLGIGGGATDFLSLTDTPGSYNANRLLFTNSGATALTDSANLTFDGTALNLTGNLDIISTTGSVVEAESNSTVTYLDLNNTNTGVSALRLLDSGSGRWIVGNDGNDSDAFKISAASAFGTNDYFTIDRASGNVGVGTTTDSTAATFTVLGGQEILPGQLTGIGSVVDGVGGTDTLAGAIALDVRGDYAYVAANGEDGIQIIDISDPANLTGVGSITDETNGADELEGAIDVVVSGNYAYVTSFADDGVQIIDISDPTNPVGVGSITDGSNGAIALNGSRSIEVVGRYAYVAASSDSAIQIIDISDPTNPVGVGSITDGNNGADTLAAARSIDVVGNYAYVTGFDDNGVQIIDISDPTNPVGVGSITDGNNGADTLGGVENIRVVGNYAYTVASLDAGLQIIDISDPTNPVGVGSITDGSNGADELAGAINLAISGSYAYVTGLSDDGVQIIDISDPTNPVGVGSITDGSNGAALLNGARGIALAGNFAYIAASVDNGVQILNLGGLKTPTAEIGSLLATRLDTDGLFAGDATFAGGLNVGQNALINGALTIQGTASSSLLSSNANPSFIVQSGYVGIGTTSPSATLDVWGDFQVGEGATSTFVVDTAGEQVLFPFGSSAAPGFAFVDDSDTGITHDFDGTFMFVSNGSVGMTLGSTYLSSNNTGGFSLNTVGGGLLEPTYNFVGDANTGMYSPAANEVGLVTDELERLRIDGDGNVGIGTTSPSARLTVVGDQAITPDSLTGVGSVTDGDAGIDELANADVIEVVGDYAYVVANSSLQILDVSDPTNPVGVGEIADGSSGATGMFIVTDLAVVGDYVYVTGALDNAVQVIDVSDPTDPVGVASIVDGSGGTTVMGSPEGIAVSGNYAYVTSLNDDAVQVLDISDPLNPVGVGSITDGSNGATVLNGPKGITISGNYAYVAGDFDNGVQVLDISDPTSPAGVGAIIDGSDGATELAGVKQIVVRGNYLYASGKTDDGIQIIDVSDPTNPVGVGAITDDGTTVLDGVTELALAGDYLYAASDIDDGVQIIDISSSTNPIAVTSVVDGASGTDQLEGASDIAIVGNYAYVASFVDDGVQVLDLGGLKAPTAQIGALAAGRIDVQELYSNNANINGSINVSEGALVYGDFGTFGDVRFSGYSAGTLQTDANGNVTVSSDERLKDNIVPYEAGLEAVLALEPITYNWASTTRYDLENTYAGFSAQNVQANLPLAVGEDKDGFLTLQDRPILAAVVTAVKEMWLKITTLEEKVEQIELLEERIRQLEENSGMSYTPPATTPENESNESGSGNSGSNNENEDVEDSSGTPTSTTTDEVATTTVPDIDDTSSSSTDPGGQNTPETTNVDVEGVGGEVTEDASSEGVSDTENLTQEDPVETQQESSESEAEVPEEESDSEVIEVDTGSDVGDSG